MTLDSSQGDVAADIISRERVSVADAHVGAAVTVNGWRSSVILTSDLDDMRRVCSPIPVTPIRV